MTTVIQSVKGTRDFYPEEKFVLSWLSAKIRKVSEAFGYQEYDGPYLETIELYAAKSGEELVKEQSFVFEDRGGNLVTLRPELTPTLVRMVAQRQNQLTFPLRWWSFGPFWRYERPQKGRSREFYQWNIDLVGVGTPEGDAELAAVIATFFKEVGLTSQDVAILVNNRRLLDGELGQLNIPPGLRSEVFRLIDRRGKMVAARWEIDAREVGLSDNQIIGLTALLANTQLWKQSEELQRFFAAVDALGVDDYVQYAPDVIRGLDYYTGIVFEAYDRKNTVRRSILGGGRYDNLMAEVGGDPLPGVGFAMGDMVITLILDKFGLLPKNTGETPAPVFITTFDWEYILSSFALAAEIRQAGFKVACYPQEDNLTRQFKYADRIGSRVAIVLGPDEIKENLVSLKDLRSGQQRTIPRKFLVDELQQILAPEAPP